MDIFVGTSWVWSGGKTSSPSHLQARTASWEPPTRRCYLPVWSQMKHQNRCSPSVKWPAIRSQNSWVGKCVREDRNLRWIPVRELNAAIYLHAHSLIWVCLRPWWSLAYSKSTLKSANVQFTSLKPWNELTSAVRTQTEGSCRGGPLYHLSDAWTAPLRVVCKVLHTFVSRLCAVLVVVWGLLCVMAVSRKENASFLCGKCGFTKRFMNLWFDCG